MKLFAADFHRQVGEDQSFSFLQKYLAKETAGGQLIWADCGDGLAVISAPSLGTLLAHLLPQNDTK